MIFFIGVFILKFLQSLNIKDKYIKIVENTVSFLEIKNDINSLLKLLKEIRKEFYFQVLFEKIIFLPAYKEKKL